MKNFEVYFYNLLKKIIKKNTGLHEPIFTKQDLRYVNSCIKSTFVSTRGNFTQKFEKKLSKIVGSKYIVALNSGTAGLELALRTIGIKNNDEVLVPAMTFVASVNSIKFCNATPHFVDSDISNLGIDTNKLYEYLKKNTYKKKGYLYNKKTRRRVFAIMPVHIFGMPSNIKEIIKLAKNFNLKVVEDATEALGSKIYGKQMGTFGDIGVLSFNANKIITTGGGGALILNKKKYYKKAFHLSSTAKIKHKWLLKHNEVGWNIRMPAINASLGYNKLKNFSKILSQKRSIASKYRKLFSKTDINFLDEKNNVKSNFWLNTIILSDEQIKLREKVLNYCNNNGIECRPAWSLISEMDVYKKNPKANLENAIKLQKKIINLPSGLNIL